jgi:hypothetical protein
MSIQQNNQEQEVVTFGKISEKLKAWFQSLGPTKPIQLDNNPFGKTAGKLPSELKPGIPTFVE